MKKYRINEFIELRLEQDKTMIYIAGEQFKQCRYLLLINPDKNDELQKINSIDEAKDKLKSDLEKKITPIELGITPEEEFWGHCSNLKGWVEFEYDTRLLHSNLSFPILKRLTELGDEKAKNILKKELKNRINDGSTSLITYLINEKYLPYGRNSSLLKHSDFTKEDIAIILENGNWAPIEYIIEEGIVGKLDREEFLSALLGYDEKGIEEASTILEIENKLNIKFEVEKKVDGLYNSFSVKKNRINELSITSQVLKFLPKTLGNLISLNSLFLSGNELKHLPKFFEIFNQLKKLILNDNSFREVPHLISKLKSLEILDLEHNQITSFQNIFNNLQHLKKINLKNNQITKTPKILKLIKEFEKKGVEFII